MKKGPLNRRITIHGPILEPDGYGDDREAFGPLGTVWASVLPSPGRERLANAQNAADALTVFRIRWVPRFADLTPAARVEYPKASGRMYDIKSVVEIGRRDGIEIAAVGSAD